MSVEELTDTDRTQLLRDCIRHLRASGVEGLPSDWFEVATHTSISPCIIFVGEELDISLQSGQFSSTSSAGELLIAAITKGMGLTSADVLIINIDPARLAREDGQQELYEQLRKMDPQVVLLLGKISALSLCSNEVNHNQEEDQLGRWQRWKSLEVLTTLHPKDVIQDPLLKRSFWNDLQLVMAKLGIASQIAQTQTKRSAGTLEGSQ